MASIYEALLSGGLGSEQDYYAKDPFYMSGARFAQTQMPTPTTNSEALWMPALQGLLSGALVGYGKNRANESAYQDYKASPIVGMLGGKAYASDTMPEGWTPTKGKQDLVLGALSLQKADEQRKQQLEQRDAIEKLLLSKGATIDPTQFTPGAPITNNAIVPLKTLQDMQVNEEVRKAQAIEAIKSKYSNPALPGFENIPKPLQTEAVKEAQIQKNKIQSLDFIDKKFDEAKKLNGGKAGITSVLGVPTAEGNALKGLGDSVVVQIDRVLGREMNSDVRQRVLTLAPKWYDSDQEIEKKKAALKDLVSSLSTATPILDTFNPQKAETPSVNSADQARAILRMRGVKGY